jgi:hypothetical protein
MALPRFQMVIDGQRVDADPRVRPKRIDRLVRSPGCAVHEYTATKAVWVELSGGTRDPFTLG